MSKKPIPNKFPKRDVIYAKWIAEQNALSIRRDAALAKLEAEQQAERDFFNAKWNSKKVKLDAKWLKILDKAAA